MYRFGAQVCHLQFDDAYLNALAQLHHLKGSWSSVGKDGSGHRRGSVPVCVCPYKMEAIACLKFGSNSKSHNGGQVPGEIVSSTSLKVPF